MSKQKNNEVIGDFESVTKETTVPEVASRETQYAFPLNPWCPKCGSHCTYITLDDGSQKMLKGTRQVSTQGNIQYRKCKNCGTGFKTIGKPTELVY